MLKEIIVSSHNHSVKIALLENRIPVEVYVETGEDDRIVGSVFKGKVENVLPGIEAAFVNVGLERNAFLYVDDVVVPGPKKRHNAKIKDLLRPGQEVLVQVVKDMFGNKGPRVTMRVNLPGRFTVLMPTVSHIGVSRRIESDRDRERLRRIAQNVRPNGMGIIIRTAARGVPEEIIREDVALLNRQWQQIQGAAQATPAPALLYSEQDLLGRVLRDLFTHEVERLVVDTPQLRDQVLALLDGIDPQLKTHVYWEDRDNVFAFYGIEQEIQKALQRRIWLKSGGYLIFDQAEALTAIDVNTGKYTGRTDLEHTVFQTNMEAAVEIARQLRLRNIGGIIIVDFIDMIREDHRAQVLATLAAEIKKDRRRTHILGLTRLGLVELTRKKVYPSLAEMLLVPCPSCGGTGKVIATHTH
ncbi:MAG: Rne/Rng family ribonuclease [Desulfotomaculales bacterium]